MKSIISLAIMFVYVMIAITGCAFKSVTRSKGITYLPEDNIHHRAAQTLNVFAPSGTSPAKEVLIFIHGGSWNSGKKSTYNFLGNRMARKGIVTVIIDYPESPAADYHEMAMDAALAVKWVKENIGRFGGDTGRIFLSGHSAGGHLAALVTVDKEYFQKAALINPVKGVILIDAAGLDMYTYLATENLPADDSFFSTFTSNPDTWKDASPLYHLGNGLPPFMIYTGERTYPSIKESNEKFTAALKRLGYHPLFQMIPRKKHVAMISQFLNSGNKRYREMIGFMKR